MECALPEELTITDDIALRWKQQGFNPLPGVTARGMAGMLANFDRGYLRTAAMAWESMIQIDETLVTAVPKMKRRVASRPWNVNIGEEVPDELRAEAEKHQAALKYFYSKLRCENAVEKNEKGGIKLLIRRVMEAPLNRFSIARMIWKPSAQGLTAVARYVPLALFDNTSGELRWAGVEGRSPGQAINDPENWLMAVSDTCLMKALSACYIFKRLPMQDALSFCQRFGIPTVHGETQAKPGTKEWDAFVSALRCFANDLTIATTLGDKFNVLETAAANGEAVFGWIIKMMQQAMVTICCGSDLATMSRANGTGASLQGDEADEMTADFCGFVTEVFNDQLDRRVIEDQFGVGVEPLAFFQLIPPQNEDADLEMKTDDHVTKHGVVLDPDDVAERFSRTNAKGLKQPATAKTKPTDRNVPPTSEDGAAANEAALSALEEHQLAEFLNGVGQDAEPLIATLRPLVFATGANATRDALHTLGLNLGSLEDQVMDQDASTRALEVSIAADFLRGLSAGSDPVDAANARWGKDEQTWKKKGPSPGRFRSVSSIADVVRDAGDKNKADAESGFKVDYSTFVRGALAKITGMDVDKIDHTIDTQAVRHIRKAHKENEITNHDFERIADVIGNADRVYASPTKSGEAGVEFWKKDGSWMLVVETIHKPHALRIHNFKRMKEIRREAGEAAPPA